MSEKMVNEQTQIVSQDHDILFLDFLGFAEAVQHLDDERMGNLIGVVEEIANAQSTFDMGGEAQKDGSYKITSWPEITTFSDHIVVSFPQLTNNTGLPDEYWKVFLNGWAGMVRQQMANIAAQVAMVGLRVGLLVRGALSRGKLYHHGRVVVGEAMVDAYQLEHTVALNPRVVVSPRITDDDRLFTDTDGQRCLDYITEMMLLALDRHGDALAWAQARLVEIETTINDLNVRKRAKDAAKWVYFRDALQKTLSGW